MEMEGTDLDTARIFAGVNEGHLPHLSLRRTIRGGFIYDDDYSPHDEIKFTVINDDDTGGCRRNPFLVSACGVYPL